ncbi:MULTISPECIES: chorismate mutase [Brachybacterium]|uniref:Chorismate mutase n=1 Tax=Brachybacterium alimentarium TaxID=47845 RepID=A0A2A3YLP1_9MICO|nr:MULTISPECIES: chorismate mutase [Brachybacterium]PCC34835.1 chorismate mutase [Brachybacterium alimentarium]PCC40213.1 chorismate mutase [Brachybacterium alimentarium]RCS62339.1 chorismate mutase [Brachybacterium sp. JB7]RCS69003.1 chorismate mutase [Brachybacterium alimentarium]RCS75962.1 chorismate mutase [Brachybacterium alimentarium]
MSQPPRSATVGEDPVDRAREILVEERRSIDNIDAALVHLLAERFAHTQRVGVLKATYGLPPADPSREQEQIARLRTLAHDAGLDPVFAEAFMRFIVTEVIRHHERIRDEGPSHA